jgi:hypothetical protein
MSQDIIQYSKKKKNKINDKYTSAPEVYYYYYYMHFIYMLINSVTIFLKN